MSLCAFYVPNCSFYGLYSIDVLSLKAKWLLDVLFTSRVTKTFSSDELRKSFPVMLGLREQYVDCNGKSIGNVTKLACFYSFLQQQMPFGNW